MDERLPARDGGHANVREAHGEVERLAAVEDDEAERRRVPAHHRHDRLHVDHLETARVREREGAPAVEYAVGVAAKEPHRLASEERVELRRAHAVHVRHRRRRRIRAPPRKRPRGGRGLIRWLEEVVGRRSGAGRCGGGGRVARGVAARQQDAVRARRLVGVVGVAPLRPIRIGPPAVRPRPPAPLRVAPRRARPLARRRQRVRREAQLL